jgi:hypothetical protein
VRGGKGQTSAPERLKAVKVTFWAAESIQTVAKPGHPSETKYRGRASETEAEEEEEEEEDGMETPSRAALQIGRVELEEKRWRRRVVLEIWERTKCPPSSCLSASSSCQASESECARTPITWGREGMERFLEGPSRPAMTCPEGCHSPLSQ